MEPLPLIVKAWFGVMAADSLVVHWGRRFGSYLLRYRFPACRAPWARFAAMQQLMRRRKPACPFGVHLIPELRTTLLFAAGSLKTPYRQLPIYDAAAALIELPVLVYGARYLGARWEAIVGLVQRY